MARHPPQYGTGSQNGARVRRVPPGRPAESQPLQHDGRQRANQAAHFTSPGSVYPARRHAHVPRTLPGPAGEARNGHAARPAQQNAGGSDAAPVKIFGHRRRRRGG